MTETWHSIKADWQANARNPKGRFVVVFFRFVHLLRGDSKIRKIVFFPIFVIYEILIDWMMGIEIPPKTTIGKGLVIYHGQGIVIHDRSILGCNVILRQGVTIGQKKPGGPTPRIEDEVDIGVSAIILGGIIIGEGASIGAGTLVTKDVPAGGKARNRSTIIG
jgi:serine acetyltransferase